MGALRGFVTCERRLPDCGGWSDPWGRTHGDGWRRELHPLAPDSSSIAQWRYLLGSADHGASYATCMPAQSGWLEVVTECGEGARQAGRDFDQDRLRPGSGHKAGRADLGDRCATLLWRMATLAAFTVIMLLLLFQL